jgi:outer membrane protein OmpA-like peptidoglycan-associated protein
MVEPSRLRRFATVAILAALTSGCGLVPKARLEECHKQCQSLQAETNQLKDVALKLRAHNQDLAQRAVDDARRLQALDEVNDRLERSVHAYQTERDELSAAFERFKAQLQASADPVPTAMLDRLREFSKTHPGCDFDPDAAVSTFPADRLFREGTGELTPESKELLRQFADQFKGDGSRDLAFLVVGRSAESAVRRASIGDKDDGGRGLGVGRANRVRDALIKEAGLDPSQIGVAGYDASLPRDAEVDDQALARNRRIEVHLRRIASSTAPAQEDCKVPIPGPR